MIPGQVIRWLVPLCFARECLSAVGSELGVWVREEPHIRSEEKNASEGKKKKVLASRETCTSNENGMVGSSNEYIFILTDIFNLWWNTSILTGVVSRMTLPPFTRHDDSLYENEYLTRTVYAYFNEIWYASVYIVCFKL